MARFIRLPPPCLALKNPWRRAVKRQAEENGDKKQRIEETYKGKHAKKHAKSKKRHYSPSRNRRE